MFWTIKNKLRAKRLPTKKTILPQKNDRVEKLGMFDTGCGGWIGLEARGRDWLVADFAGAVNPLFDFRQRFIHFIEFVF